MLLAAAALGFASCEDYPDAFVLADGQPTVQYVRYADRDVLIEQAFMGEVVCFVGENLCSVRELYFNDQRAVLNTSFMTENTLVAAVPGNLPKVKTDKVYMITKGLDTLAYDFKVLLPAPVIKSMSCEFQQPGTDVTVYGNYFAEPMSLVFEDGNGAEVTSFKSVSMTEVTFTIPADAKPGKIKVTTESGVARSPFSYHDFCDGLITDFDGPNYSSSTHGVVPQGWNFSGTYSSEGGISGNYVELKSANPPGAVTGTATLWALQMEPVFLFATSSTSLTSRTWPSSSNSASLQAILGCQVRYSLSSVAPTRLRTIHGRTIRSSTLLLTAVSTSAADSIVHGRQQARSTQVTSG